MTKGCYTCRRRRVICDNGLPSCRKCRDAGKECLGYQKPLVWVKGGLASRGKMMGRSFDQTGKYSTNSEGTDSSMVGPLRAVGAPDQDEHDSQRDSQTETMPPQRTTTLMTCNSPPRILVDPLFQDLNPLMRFYVVHCM